MAGVGLLNNILRAASKFTIPVIINFVAFYLVGLPLGALLAFGAPELELGLTALWIGLDVGMATMVPKSASAPHTFTLQTQYCSWLSDSLRAHKCMAKHAHRLE